MGKGISARDGAEETNDEEDLVTETGAILCMEGEEEAIKAWR